MRLGVVDASPAPRPLGVLKTIHYRPELFGRPFSDALELALRGPSDWSEGERELFVNGVLRHSWNGDFRGVRSRIGIGVARSALQVRELRVDATL